MNQDACIRRALSPTAGEIQQSRARATYGDSRPARDEYQAWCRETLRQWESADSEEES